MKKILLLAFIAICIGLVIPSKVYADATIGATVWYASWNYDGEVDIDSAFLFGPTLSVKIDDTLSFTFVYLYGKYEDDYGGKTSRSDADLALNARLNDYFKFYGGLKFIYISGNLLGLDGLGHYGIGPGLGLSLTFPLSENLFFLANVGAFYLFGSEWSDVWDTSGINDSGFNAAISLAYYINPVVLSIGYRYQSVTTSYDKDYESTSGKFSGVTFAVSYSF